ncbi:MFS transporter [Thiomonas sp.]|jgi:MFS family permease|uniref:MFS transporter n=1 Tax=Thiomonas sp. TaxID=2047785 RepID=UPI00260503D3|nr:MFS transporter [Thiomonas sp.]
MSASPSRATPDSRAVPGVAAPGASKALIVFASTLGTTIEWYDFFLYGVLTPLVLNRLFFPDLSPVIGTIAAYTTFAVGFLSRPIGGIIFGHFGDRIGRKTILVLTMLIMGGSTFLIGALPTTAAVGVAAPLLLLVLRVLQGIGIGGEWGGAVLMTIEHASPGKRALYGSWPQLGVPLGLMSSAAVVALLNLLPDSAFISWGWRVAFFMSGLLVAIGLYVRLRILETPDFERAQREKRIVPVPVAVMFRDFKREVVLTLGARYVEGACFNTFGVFSIYYITHSLGLSRGDALSAVIISSALMLPFIVLSGWAADRFGLRRVFSLGAVFIAAASVFSFWIMHKWGAHNYGVVLLGLIVPFTLGYPMVYGPESSLFASQFDAHVRYTGVSFAYQFSGIFASGLTPLIATALIGLGHGKPWLVAGYMVLVALVSLVSVAFMRGVSREDARRA